MYTATKNFVCRPETFWQTKARTRLITLPLYVWIARHRIPVTWEVCTHSNFDQISNRMDQPHCLAFSALRLYGKAARLLKRTDLNGSTIDGKRSLISDKRFLIIPTTCKKSNGRGSALPRVWYLMRAASAFVRTTSPLSPGQVAETRTYVYGWAQPKESLVGILQVELWFFQQRLLKPIYSVDVQTSPTLTSTCVFRS